MNGIVNLLKPPGMTSHDAVAVVRRCLKMKKVGHTGTLDPMAAGVLPICVGMATRAVEHLQEDQKVYRGELTLGVITDTQDRWGEVLETRPVKVTKNQLLEAIETFTGEIEQIPPMFSALKVNGQKLCDLARKGKIVERQPRKRTIYTMELIDFDGSKALIDIRCSKGTYIRTLFHDIGQYLGCGGTMSFLLRTSTGELDLSNAVTVEALRACQTPLEAQGYLLGIDMAFLQHPELRVGSEWAVKIRNGQDINFLKFLGHQPKGDALYRIYSSDRFVALGRYLTEHKELRVLRHFLE